MSQYVGALRHTDGPWGYIDRLTDRAGHGEHGGYATTVPSRPVVCKCGDEMFSLVPWFALEARRAA